MRITVSDEMRAVLSAALDMDIPADVAERLHLPSTDPADYRPGGPHHPATTPGVCLTKPVSLVKRTAPAAPVSLVKATISYVHPDR